MFSKYYEYANIILGSPVFMHDNTCETPNMNVVFLGVLALGFDSFKSCQTTVLSLSKSVHLNVKSCPVN